MARFHLQQDQGELSLVDRAFTRQQPLKIDFTDAKLKHRVEQGGKKELILRAVGAKPGLRVSDWTAGLGNDSFLLAAAGCVVKMYERSRILALLLEQGLKQAQSSEIAEVISRMTLSRGDARRFEHRQSDVIYLDPMFPHRSKTALVNGPMQYLQRLIGPDFDAEQMIECALTQPVSRVVVKRPASAPEGKSTFTLSAKANRFDVYELPGADCS